MSNKVTVKVVSQLEKLHYQGIRPNRDASIGAMGRLVNQNPLRKEKSQEVSPPKLRNAVSFKLMELVDSISPEAKAPEVLHFAPLINEFSKMDDKDLRSRRNLFFSEVEAGKEELVQKHGNSVPVTEIEELSKRMSKYDVQYWKIQIVTTRTSDTPFEGSSMNKDGVFTCTRKSKTIYRSTPISKEEAEHLTSVLNTAKPVTGNSVEMRTLPNNKRAIVCRSDNGKIMFRIEDTSNTSVSYHKRE